MSTTPMQPPLTLAPIMEVLLVKESCACSQLGNSAQAIAKRVMRPVM